MQRLTARLEGVNRSYQVMVVTDAVSGDEPTFGSVAEAEAFFQTEPAQRALALVDDMELLPVDQYAMP